MTWRNHMTILPKLVRWISLVLALILLIEGAALFIGMVILSPGNPWATGINVLLLVLDILIAAVILRIVLRNPDIEHSIPLYVLLTITILTHGYRATEFFLQLPTRFLFNDTLFAMNVLKIGLAIFLLTIGLYLYFTTPKKNLNQATS